MTKKKIFVIALVVCLIAILSAGSLAWFSAQDSVKNEFFIAASDDLTKDDIFSVDVMERVDQDNDGVYDTTLSAPEGYDYKDIQPGDKLVKEPFVRNTGYYDQYIRVTVTISDAAAWVNALGADADVTKVLVGFDADKWTHIWNNTNGATQLPEELVYVMYYKDILKSGEDVSVFTHVQIPTSLDQEQAALFGGDFSISIKAEAVQTENVVPEGTAAEDAAWAAFKTVESK